MTKIRFGSMINTLYIFQNGNEVKIWHNVQNVLMEK